MRKAILAVVAVVVAPCAAAQDMSAPPAAAPPPDPRGACLSIGQALREATETGPEVALAKAEAEIARARVKQERGTAFPNVSAYARTAEGDSGLVDGRTNTQAGLIVSQRLFDFGQGHFRLRSAEASANAARSAEAGATRELALKTGTAYVEVLEDRQLLQLAESRRARLATLASGVERRLEAGLITIATANSIKAEAAAARAEHVDQQLALDSSLLSLSSLTGDSRTPCAANDDADAVLKRTVELTESQVDEAVQRDPRLHSATLRRDAAQFQYRAARRTRTPTISLQGVGAYQRDELLGRWETARRIGFDVTMPLYAGGTLGGQIEEALAKVSAAEAEIDRLARDLRQDLRSSLRRAEAYQQLALAREEAVTAERAEVDAVRRQFESGLRPYEDYERAEASLTLAERALVEARSTALREKLAVLVFLDMLPRS